MYETERLILSVTLLVVLVSWDKDNLPITIVIITGLIFNIVSVIYKSIVYKQNDKKNRKQYLQPIINQYFIGNKSEIWSLSLMVHSKRRRFNAFIDS